MTTLDDIFDERMRGGGDYPDWWEPEEEGDILEGMVTDKRMDPWAEENGDEDPGHILHVKTVDGEEFSTRTHKVLTNLIKEQNVEVGDVVRIEFTGKTKTDSGHSAYAYRLGVIKSHELDELDIEVPTADGGARAGNSGGSSSQTPAEAGEDLTDPAELEQGPDPSEFTVGELKELIETIDDPDALQDLLKAEKSADDRKSAKAAIASRFEELEDDETTEVPEEAVEFVESLISFHGELDEDDLHEYLNETRDFDVSVDSVAEAAGLVKNDDGEYVEG